MTDRRTRRTLGGDELAQARRIVELAWRDLPAPHRQLLEAIGADQWSVVDCPLGEHVGDLTVSAGYNAPTRAERADLDRAMGVWHPTLRLVVIDAGHPGVAGLDTRSFAAMLAHVAWHEWGHALSMVRATADDVANGRRLLDLVPTGLARVVRDGGYRPREYTHELVAELHATLMGRRRRGQSGQPGWLDDGVYDLLRRVTGWNE